MVKRTWTVEQIKEVLVELGYSWKPVRWHSTKLELIEETNKLNRQYYLWVKMDSEGKLWCGNWAQAAQRERILYSDWKSPKAEINQP